MERRLNEVEWSSTHSTANDSDVYHQEHLGGHEVEKDRIIRSLETEVEAQVIIQSLFLLSRELSRVRGALEPSRKKLRAKEQLSKFFEKLLKIFASSTEEQRHNALLIKTRTFTFI